MEIISLKVPKTLAARLRSTAKRRGTTKSAVIRAAIESYLSDEAPAARVSFHDLAKRYAGCVKDAPPDLSTNPRHFEGFGL